MKSKFNALLAVFGLFYSLDVGAATLDEISQGTQPEATMLELRDGEIWESLPENFRAYRVFQVTDSMAGAAPFIITQNSVIPPLPQEALNRDLGIADMMSAVLATATCTSMGGRLPTRSELEALIRALNVHSQFRSEFIYSLSPVWTAPDSLGGNYNVFGLEDGTFREIESLDIASLPSDIEPPTTVCVYDPTVEPQPVPEDLDFEAHYSWVQAI